MRRSKMLMRRMGWKKIRTAKRSAGSIMTTRAYRVYVGDSTPLSGDVTLYARYSTYGAYDFGCYYLAGGEYPSPLHESAPAANYGPENGPMCSLNFNADDLVDGLKKIYTDVDVVELDSGWAITPNSCGVTAEADYGEWWENVLDILRERTRVVFEGINKGPDVYTGYVIKCENGVGRIEGLLPAYVADIYLRDGEDYVYAGGVAGESAADFGSVRDEAGRIIAGELGLESVDINWDNGTFTLGDELYRLSEGENAPEQSLAGADSTEKIEYANAEGSSLHSAAFYLGYDMVGYDDMNGYVVVEVVTDVGSLPDDIDPLDIIGLERKTDDPEYSLWHTVSEDGYIICGFDYPEDGEAAVNIDVTLLDEDYCLLGMVYRGEGVEAAGGTYTVSGVPGDYYDTGLIIYLGTKYSVEYYYNGVQLSGETYESDTAYVMGFDVNDDDYWLPVGAKIWKNEHGLATAITLPDMEGFENVNWKLFGMSDGEDGYEVFEYTPGEAVKVELLVALI